MGVLVVDNVAVSSKALEEEHNVGNLAKYLKSLQLQEVPQRYLTKDTDGMVPFNKFADLKVIDLSLVASDRERVVKEIGEAASTLGFLQVINHNLPLDLIKKHKAMAHEFFSLPSEVKQKAYVNRNLGYNGGFTVEELGSDPLPWREALIVKFGPDGETATPEWVFKQVWPDSNPPREEVWSEYGKQVANLSRQVHELMAEHLGLRKDFFHEFNLCHDNHEVVPTIAWNNYPANPRPDRVFGAGGHVDPNTLTFLWQDDVGGLQIQGVDGAWLGVRPLDGAIVVNVGDMMQGRRLVRLKSGAVFCVAWSNDRYKSVKHRVATNSERSRQSIAVFMRPDFEGIISAPEKLVDEEHPRKYKSFKAGEFFALPTKRGSSRLGSILI